MRAALACLAIAACADVPAAPTYVDDVRPILLASCIRCHAAPAACTPLDRRRFRLDSWGDVGPVHGVAYEADRIAVRAVDLGDMPPAGPLSEREREILGRWQRAGSPRGEPPDDAPPELELRSAIPAREPDGGQLLLDVSVGAPAHDVMSWTVGWRRDGLAGELTGPLPPGDATIDVDLGVLAAGRYQLVARLRDELADRPTEVLLGAPITIPDRDAAPSVALVAPVDGNTVTQRAPVEVSWRADDADTAGPLTATLRLIDAAGRPSPLPTDAAGAWSTADTAPGRYDVEVEVSDGTASRTARTRCPLTLIP